MERYCSCPAEWSGVGVTCVPNLRLDASTVLEAHHLGGEIHSHGWRDVFGLFCAGLDETVDQVGLAHVGVPRQNDCINYGVLLYKSS